jgi:hypothetical protein
VRHELQDHQGLLVGPPPDGVDHLAVLVGRPPREPPKFSPSRGVRL